MCCNLNIIVYLIFKKTKKTGQPKPRFFSCITLYQSFLNLSLISGFSENVGFTI